MVHVDPMERVISVVALGSTMVAVLVLHFSPMKMQPEPPPPESQQVTVSVTLEAAPPEVPAQPMDAMPPPPPPVKDIQPDRPVIPVQKREPPKPRPPTPPKPEQAIAKPVETPSPMPPPVAPVATPKPAAPVANTANEEAGYIGRLRGYIRSITQYPTSGQARRERPEGSSEVRFTLSRSGQVQEVSIEQSSGSPILDKQAVSIVKGGSYPPMPVDVWAEAPEHVFTVTVVFTAP